MVPDTRMHPPQMLSGFVLMGICCSIPVGCEAEWWALSIIGERAEGLGRAPSSHQVVAATSIGHWLGGRRGERPAASVKADARLVLDKEGLGSSSCSSFLEGPCLCPLPPHGGQQSSRDSPARGGP